MNEELTEREKRILWSMFRHSLNASAAGREMYYGKNTIVYHLDKIKTKTGLDPRNFFDAVELLEMLGDSTTKEVRGNESSN